MKMPWASLLLLTAGGLLAAFLLSGCTTYRPLRGQTEAELDAMHAACRKEPNTRRCMEIQGYEATTGWDILGLGIGAVDGILNPTGQW